VLPNEVGYPFLRPDSRDTSGNGVADGDEDTDGDGLANSGEQSRRTQPLSADTDGDGLSDGSEVNTHNSDPLLFDTDGDGVPDGRKVANSSNPLVADAGMVVTESQNKIPEALRRHH
jgi:hypothetical protein